MADETTPKPDLKAAQNELEEAIAAVQEAEKAVEEANRLACERRNRLNEAQKQFDDAVAAMRRRGALPASEWSARRMKMKRSLRMPGDF